MCFPEIVIKMIQYLVGLVLRGLISTFVYVLITDDRLFKPLFEVTELLPFILNKVAFVIKIYIARRSMILHREFFCCSLENNADS